MLNIAVILSGCGHLDGAEIRESVCSLLALDRANAEVSVFAPNRQQFHSVNHLNGTETDDNRNILVEAARIARGKIAPLEDLDVQNFSALILPGGFGAAKNFSDIAIKGGEARAEADVAMVIQDFFKQKKPIGAICIAPALVTLALRNLTTAKVTLGDASNAALIEALGGHHVACVTNEICIDEKNRLVSCSAYMRDDRLSFVAEGIDKLVAAVLTLIENK
jgi:enhancing lycopene biosynthesis protein 2